MIFKKSFLSVFAAIGMAFFCICPGFADSVRCGSNENTWFNPALFNISNPYSTQVCETCPAGQYGDGMGQRCVSCSNQNEANRGNGCGTCPNGTNPSFDRTSCVICVAGYYYDSTTNNCEDCPAGSYCQDDQILTCSGQSCLSNAGDSCIGTAGGKVPNCVDCRLMYAAGYGAATGIYANENHTACIPCTGYKQYHDNDGVCHTCSTGMYVSDDYTDCVACTQGNQYHDSNGLCHTCPNTTPYANTDHTGCTACNTGSWAYVGGRCMDCNDTGTTNPYYSQNNHTSCTPCNGFREYHEDGECFACDTGFFANANNTACVQCGAGSYMLNGVCLVCQAGSYCPGDGFVYQCDDGTATENSGASSCRNCRSEGLYSNVDHTSCTACNGAGEYIDGVLCKTCPDGTVPSANHTSCIECNGSNQYVSNGVCSICPNGNYINATHTECSACNGANQYHDANGVCRTCTNGTVPTSDHTQCVQCNTGSQYNNNGVCDNCPNGTYVNQSHTACVACNGAGEYIDGVICRTCSSGTIPAADHENCVACNTGNQYNNNGVCDNCQSGYYVNSAHTQCSPCPTGSYCDGNGTAQQCSGNTVSASLGASACTVCSGATPYSNTGHTRCVACTEASYYAYNGVCTPCGAGQYVLNGICTECPAGSYCPGDGTAYQCAGNAISSAGATICQQCSGSEQYATENHTGCVACNDVREYHADGVCHTCSNFLNSDRTSCVACDGETEYYDSNYVCNTCPGNQLANENHDGCAGCIAGFCSGSGGTCDVCPAGYYCPKNTQCANAQQCPQGSFAVAGQEMCTPCAIGYTTNGSGADSADRCIQVPVKLVFSDGGTPVDLPSVLTQGKINKSVVTVVSGADTSN